MAPCWVCGTSQTTPLTHTGFSAQLTPDDLAITDSRYGMTLALRRCDACGFVFADDDQVGRLHELYERLDDPGYADTAEPRRMQLAALVDLAVRAHPSARTLLDVGAASGLLVAAATAAGLEAEGVEPSAPLAARARAGGFAVHTGGLPSSALGERRFDVVTVVDVVEHVPDPVGLLRAAAAHLAPGGVMLVVTPDAASLAARVLGRRWWHRRLAHVGYFDRRTLERALENAGLRARQWSRPAWWFRVDYLLERLGRYVPGASAAARRLGRSSRGRRLARRTVRVDLRDSLLVVAVRR